MTTDRGKPPDIHNRSQNELRSFTNEIVLNEIFASDVLLLQFTDSSHKCTVASTLAHGHGLPMLSAEGVR